MSKFKRSRDDKQPTDVQREAAIVHAADDVVIIQTPPAKGKTTKTVQEKESKTTTVSLTYEDALLLENLSRLEDRSQRKIASRLLREGIRTAA